MMIPLSLASGILVGSQAVEWMILLSGGDVGVPELWSRWSLLGYMGVLVIYLWSAFHTSETASTSVRRVLMGNGSVLFYLGVVAVGLIIPLIITLIVWEGGAEKIGGGILLTRFVCVLIGDLVMRYEIMRSGLYSPLI
jgi:formate-dependent nitrite reductase membrane component NrfD